MKANIIMGIIMSSIMVISNAFGQNFESNNDSDKAGMNAVFIPDSNNQPAETSTTTETTAKEETTAPVFHPVIHEVHSEAPRVSGLKVIPVLTTEKLEIGSTYNRYGELSFPIGYGVQVIAFKDLKNLQKYIHRFEGKELFIQVTTLNSVEANKIYRVILGANENKEFTEHEVSFFNRAGVGSVLRKHHNNNDAQAVSLN